MESGAVARFVAEWLEAEKRCAGTAGSMGLRGGCECAEGVCGLGGAVACVSSCEVQAG